MLRTILFLGLVVLVGCVLIGASLGILGFVITIAIQALILGGIAYLILKVFSPKTLAKIRDRLGS